jgi:ribonuclease G
MTRQNVTDGPREVMTKKCPTCGGDGIVVSEGTAALDVERRLRALAAGSRAQAYRIEVASKIESLLVGPGAERLMELESQTRRRFYLVGKGDVHLDHFLVLAEGKRDDLAVTGPVEEGAEVELKLGEVGLHDPQAGVGKLDGLDVCVANASKLVGKKVTVRVERVLDGTAYATLVGPEVQQSQPITAEREAEKPTRQPSAAKKAAAEKPKAQPEAEEPTEAKDTSTEEDEPKPKKKTRRGSRGGRSRKKKTAAVASASTGGNGAGAAEQIEQPVARIHVPDRDLGEETAEELQPEPAAEETTYGAEAAPKPRKKTRRGTRGGRNRKPKTTATPSVPADGDLAPATRGSDAANEEDWAYVPMSEWADDVLSE